MMKVANRLCVVFVWGMGLGLGLVGVGCDSGGVTDTPPPPATSSSVLLTKMVATAGLNACDPLTFGGEFHCEYLITTPDLVVTSLYALVKDVNATSATYNDLAILDFSPELTGEIRLWSRNCHENDASSDDILTPIDLTATVPPPMNCDDGAGPFTGTPCGVAGCEIVGLNSKSSNCKLEVTFCYEP